MSDLIIHSCPWGIIFISFTVLYCKWSRESLLYQSWCTNLIGWQQFKHIKGGMSGNKTHFVPFHLSFPDILVIGLVSTTSLFYLFACLLATPPGIITNLLINHCHIKCMSLMCCVLAYKAIRSVFIHLSALLIRDVCWRLWTSRTKCNLIIKNRMDLGSKIGYKCRLASILSQELACTFSGKDWCCSWGILGLK